MYFLLLMQSISCNSSLSVEYQLSFYLCLSALNSLQSPSGQASFQTLWQCSAMQNLEAGITHDEPLHNNLHYS